MPTELIEPFERELRRRARTERNDGFSDDGLSYSVANDFGKLWGQAAAEYDARTSKPRNDVYGQTLEEDTPEALRHQLLDPLMDRFGEGSTSGRSRLRAPAARTYKFGNQLVSIDPTTMQTTPVYTAPDKPDNRGDSFERALILGKISALRAAQKDPVYKYSSPEKKKEIEDQIAALEAEGRKIYEPEATTLTPVPAVPDVEPRPPIGFIGNPLGANQFELPPPSGTNTISKPAGATKKRLIFNPQSGRLE